MLPSLSAVDRLKGVLSPCANIASRVTAGGEVQQENDNQHCAILQPESDKQHCADIVNDDQHYGDCDAINIDDIDVDDEDSVASTKNQYTNPDLQVFTSTQPNQLDAILNMEDIEIDDDSVLSTQDLSPEQIEKVVGFKEDENRKMCVSQRYCIGPVGRDAFRGELCTRCKRWCHQECCIFIEYTAGGKKDRPICVPCWRRESFENRSTSCGVETARRIAMKNRYDNLQKTHVQPVYSIPFDYKARIVKWSVAEYNYELYDLFQSNGGIDDNIYKEGVIRLRIINNLEMDDLIFANRHLIERVREQMQCDSSGSLSSSSNQQKVGVTNMNNRPRFQERKKKAKRKKDDDDSFQANENDDTNELPTTPRKSLRIRLKKRAASASKKGKKNNRKQSSSESGCKVMDLTEATALTEVTDSTNEAESLQVCDLTNSPEPDSPVARISYTERSYREEQSIFVQIFTNWLPFTIGIKGSYESNDEVELLLMNFRREESPQVEATDQLVWYFPQHPEAPRIVRVRKELIIRESPIGPLNYFGDIQGGMANSIDVLCVLSDLTERAVKVMTMQPSSFFSKALVTGVIQALLQTSDDFKLERVDWVNPWSTDRIAHIHTYDSIIQNLLKALIPEMRTNQDTTNIR